MKRKYILDEEINLNDLDLLNTKVYADNLKHIIVNSPKNKVFSVGLFGGWGTGKSSIIKTLQRDLESQNESHIKFIIYDAWKYANDSFRRMFLLKLQEDLNFHQTGLMEKFYSIENRETKYTSKINKVNLSISILIVILGLVVVYSVNFQLETSIIVAIIVPFLTLLSNILFKVFDQVKISIQKPSYFAPEQFEDCFKQIISKSLRNYNWIEKTGLYINGEKFEKNIDKLVLVIDNIDRCPNELAYSLLTDIKTFMGNENYNIVFVIPVDDESLKKHIIRTSKAEKDCNHEAEEFLRKFFNITIRLKPFQPKEMFDFAERVNSTYCLNFSPITIGLASKEYATNPRRIIQFFNNLTSELNQYDDVFIKENEAVICKLQILKEEFPEYYKIISGNPHLVNNVNTIIEQELKKNEPLKNFLEKTQIITQDVPYAVFDRIFNNSYGMGALPQEVANLLENLKYNEINELLSNQPDQLYPITNQIIENLSKAQKRELWDLDFINSFELLMSVNAKHEISKAENIRIHELIQNKFGLIIEKIRQLDNLVEYSITTSIQGIKFLKPQIINYISGNTVKEAKIINRNRNLLELCINKYKDEDALTMLRKPFFEIYQIDDGVFQEDLVAEEQVKYLITNEFIDFIIANIASISEEDHHLIDIMTIIETYGVSDKNVELLLEKIGALLPDFRGKNLLEVIDYLKVINDIFSLIGNDLSKSTVNIKSIVNKFYPGWKVPHTHPQYAPDPSQDTLKDLINESSDNTEQIEILSSFYSNVYRLTKNSVNVVEAFNKISTKESNRQIVNEDFLELKEHFSITPLFNVILSDNSYSSDCLSLLKYAFTNKVNDDYTLPEEQEKSKIAEILNFNLEGKDQIYKFLEDLSDMDTRAKNILIALISSKEKSSILMLPNKLQALAIDSILSNEKIFQYQENEGFLKVVASNGKTTHIQQLVRLLVSMIQKEQSLNSAISIILEISHLQKKDATRLITELETYAENEEFKEGIQNAINKLNDFVK